MPRQNPTPDYSSHRSNGGHFFLPIGFLIAFGAMVFSNHQMTKGYPLPYPHFDQFMTVTSGFDDAVLVSFGFRALTADIAWIELLQNMGDYTSRRAERANRSYAFLKEDTLRVTRIDPYFHRAYLFGAVTLAYLGTTHRFDEAMEVLREGIKYNPKVWQFQKYAAAIGYKENGEFEPMVQMLESVVDQPDCPTIVKVILANAYKENKRYLDALVVWTWILQNASEKDYIRRAEEQVPILQRLAAQQSNSR